MEAKKIDDIAKYLDHFSRYVEKVEKIGNKETNINFFATTKVSSGTLPTETHGPFFVFVLRKLNPERAVSFQGFSCELSSEKWVPLGMEIVFRKRVGAKVSVAYCAFFLLLYFLELLTSIDPKIRWSVRCVISRICNSKSSNFLLRVWTQLSLWKGIYVFLVPSTSIWRNLASNFRFVVSGVFLFI